MKLAKMVELIGKRWDILEKLSKKKYYASKLAEELGKSPPEISKNLKELEKNGLVRREQKEGERLKYCYLTDYAKKILTSINQVAQLKPETKLEKWQINELLNILEDDNLSEDVRLEYSESFRRICSEHPTEVATHRGAQRLFEKVAADPFHDKIREDLMRSLSAILRRLRKEWSNWVLKKLYPVFVKNVGNKELDPRIREWALKRVGEIANSGIVPSKKTEVQNLCLEIWFSDDIDPETDLGKEVKQQLVNLASRDLFENIKASAKDQNPKVKAKAELLLKRLKEWLLP
ncbi:transcriptional regulator [Candidatus Bathyarchaeota archaeon]|nr:MAG: transcriptional regulator [Candidatus Bathyarchaeota archaeon]